MSGVSGSSLSCIRCKWKKVGCDKASPKCSRCQTSNIECVYPQRQPRIRKKKTEQESLSSILQRLKRIESRVSDSEHSTPSSNGDGADGKVVGGDILSWGSLQHDEEREIQSTSASSYNGQNLIRSGSILQMVAEATNYTLAALASSPTTAGPSSSAQITSDTLSNVLFNIQNLKLSSGQPDHLHVLLDLPLWLAKKWIKTCFQQMSADIFVGLADENLMLTFPDVVNLPYVQIDQGALLCYNFLLGQGSRLDNDTPLDESLLYSRRLYRNCLKIVPTWQKNASTTQMDFVASVLMTWFAIENFDYHRSWNFHRKACKLAKDLGIHQLDATPSSCSISPNDNIQREGLRRGFWELIQTDCLFQLHHNRAAAISNTEFNVNLPAVMASTGEDTKKNGPIMAFIASARITFITMEFFDLLDRKPDQIVLEAGVEELCEQLDLMIEEWNIMDWLEKSCGTPTDRFTIWLYGDVLVNGYTSIVLMQRKAAALYTHTDHNPPSLRSVAAARKALHAICVVARIMKTGNLSTANFIAFYPFVAFFTLYYHVLHFHLSIPTSHFEGIEEDMALMEELGSVMEHLSQTQEEYLPIVHAVRALNKVSRHAFEGKMRASASTPVVLGDVPRSRHAAEPGVSKRF